MTKDAVFRVTGIPHGATIEYLEDVLFETFGEEGTLNTKQTTICPSCADDTQTALIQFIQDPPRELEALPHLNTYKIEFRGDNLRIDKNFRGFTQLYPTEGEIKADVVSLCGIDGHAYGSWRGRGNVRKMWLRDYLSKDAPSCRTMIYGYDSKLEGKGAQTTPGFANELLQDLVASRRTEEERKRPLIFVVHCFGGIIVTQALVKAQASMDRRVRSLHSATYAIMFFGTPHRGLMVDDIRTLLGGTSPREKLLDSIKEGAVLLEAELNRFINICQDIKIVSFYETDHSRKLVKGEDGKWSRTGDYFMIVGRESSMINLPNGNEESLPAEGDHSSMVKFGRKTRSKPYATVLKYLSKLGATTRAVNRHLTPRSAVITRGASDLERVLRPKPLAMYKPYKNSTLLHTAAGNGDEEAISMILEQGVDVGEVNHEKDTALHIAARAGHKRVIEMLLGNGADIAETGQNGFGALHFAAGQGHQDIVELLLSKGAYIEAVDGGITKYTALHLAAIRGYEKVVEVLMRNGANIMATDNNQHMALHFAAAFGHEKVIEVLLRNKADMTVTDEDERTALHLAAIHGHDRVLEVLLRNGADITDTDDYRLTALHLAARNGHEKIVEILLRKKADIMAMDNDQRTALHLATIGGHERALEVLLQSGADATAKDKNQYTALQLAVTYGHEGAAEILLKYGAKSMSANSNTSVVLSLGDRSQQRGVIGDFLQYLVGITAADDYISTALLRAALTGYGKVVSVLRNTENNVALDLSGNSALQLGIKSTHMVAAMIARG